VLLDDVGELDRRLAAMFQDGHEAPLGFELIDAGHASLSQPPPVGFVRFLTRTLPVALALAALGCRAYRRGVNASAKR
jgi:hypothetical protein